MAQLCNFSWFCWWPAFRQFSTNVNKILFRLLDCYVLMFICPSVATFVRNCYSNLQTDWISIHKIFAFKNIKSIAFLNFVHKIDYNVEKLEFLTNNIWRQWKKRQKKVHSLNCHNIIVLRQNCVYQNLLNLVRAGISFHIEVII